MAASKSAVTFDYIYFVDYHSTISYTVQLFAVFQVDKLSLTVDKPSSPKVQNIIKPEMLLTNSPPPLPDKSHGNDNMFCFKRAKKRRRWVQNTF